MGAENAKIKSAEKKCRNGWIPLKPGFSTSRMHLFDGFLYLKYDQTVLKNEKMLQIVEQTVLVWHINGFYLE